MARIKIAFISIILVLLSFLFDSCVNEFIHNQADKEKEAKELKDRTKVIDSICKVIDTNLTLAEESGNDSAYELAQHLVSGLSWSNRRMLTESDSIESLKQFNKVVEMKSNFSKRINLLQQNAPLILFLNDEVKFGNKFEPFYYSLPKCDSLIVEATCDSKFASISVIGESTKNVLFTKTNIKSIKEKIFIPHTDVYSISFSSKIDQFGSVIISRIPKSFSMRKYETIPEIDTVKAIKTEKNAIAYPVIEFINVFNEPHKAKLNSLGKKMLGFGESRIVIPINLPSKTKGWLYRLRISFDNEDRNEDGKFVKDCRSSYTVMKVHGVTVYEKDKQYSSLIRELLNRIFSPTKEEAYCNLFVIPDQKNTKAFLAGGKFDYNLNSSQKNIQSMNCEVTEPIKGHIYLGLENTNMTKSVYIWLEVVATTESTAYYKLIRKVKGSE